MIFYIKLYGAALLAFLIIDVTWIGLIAKSFYSRHIGYILAENPVWPAAISFYLIFVMGILVFVVLPGLEAESIQLTLLRGAFFGLVCYATFDLTCQALLKDWPMVVTIVDMIWGAILTTAVSAVAFLVGRWLS